MSNNKKLEELTTKSSFIAFTASMLICLICCITVAILFDHTKGLVGVFAVGGIMFNFIIILIFGVLSFEFLINLIVDIFKKKRSSL